MLFIRLITLICTVILTNTVKADGNIPNMDEMAAKYGFESK